METLEGYFSISLGTVLGKNLIHEWSNMATPLIDACSRSGFESTLLNLVLPSNFNISFRLFETTLSHNYVTFLKLPSGPLIMRDRRQFNTVPCPPTGLRYGGNPLVLYKWDTQLTIEDNMTPWHTREVEAEFPWNRPPHCNYCGLETPELGLVGIHIPSNQLNTPFWGYFRYDFEEKLKDM